MCVNLTWLRNAHKADETLFQGMSMKTFLEENNIWIVDRIKKISPSYQEVQESLVVSFTWKKEFSKGTNLALKKGEGVYWRKIEDRVYLERGYTLKTWSRLLKGSEPAARCIGFSYRIFSWSFHLCLEVPTSVLKSLPFFICLVFLLLS